MVVSTDVFLNADKHVWWANEEPTTLKKHLRLRSYEKLYGITANVSLRRKTMGNFNEGIIIAVKRTTFYGVLSQADVNDEELQMLFKGNGSFLLET